ncbi:glutamine amidotransferase-related protein, partial [Klebsiella aerogenes]
EIDWVDSQELTAENVAERIGSADGILVPGGFGDRGIEGKIEAIRFARENDVPFLGICLGMQMACVEFGRNVVGLEDAGSAETNPDVTNNIIDLMADQENIENLGGTLRLGLYPCKMKKGTKTAAAYVNEDVVQERHRHR